MVLLEKYVYKNQLCIKIWVQEETRELYFLFTLVLTTVEDS